MKNTVWTNPFAVFLLAFLCCALWGSAAPFIKFGYELFSIDTSQTGQILQFAGARFAAAGILVILVGSVVFKHALVPEKEDIVPVLVLAFFQTAGQYFFYYIGVAHTTGVSAAVITGTGAFIALLVAALVFRYEKLTMLKTAGCILGFFGIWILNGMKTGSGFSVSGEGLVLVSQLFSAFSAAFIKLFSQKRNAMLLSGYQFLAGGIMLSAIGIAMSPHSTLTMNWQGGGILFYLAFVSAAAYSMWSYLLKYNPISKIGMYECWIPLTGVLWSAILLQEISQALSWNTLIALLCIILGIRCVNKEDTI